ncbi:MAG: hypothetical protein ACFCUV_23710 [Rivularia sp. (in: cyanobacteria)]
MPDFWSWRNGVFRFNCQKKSTVAPRDIEHFRSFIPETNWQTVDEDNEYFLPLEDLQRLIQEIEVKPGTNEATLGSLYTQLGRNSEMILYGGVLKGCFWGNIL